MPGHGHDRLEEDPGILLITPEPLGLQEADDPALLQPLGRLIGKAAHVLSLLGLGSEKWAHLLDPFEHLMFHCGAPLSWSWLPVSGLTGG